MRNRAAEVTEMLVFTYLKLWWRVYMSR